jgi:SAM-dependent methyltransferase
MTWRDFWNTDTPIYANARHKEVHYRLLADDIVRLLPEGGGRVLDYGCGEALSADRIAARVAHLYLCDAAPLVRERLQARFAGVAKISVLAPEELDRVGEGTLALAILNSVLQYLDPAERDQVLAAIRRKLHPGGRLIVADILPHDLSPLRDARALIGLAAANGFLAAAAGGLVRTYFSSYRRLRAELGLRHYDEPEMLAVLNHAGFSAHRLPTNLGHNQARMAFEARRS